MSRPKTGWWDQADEDGSVARGPLTSSVYEARCMMCGRQAGEIRLTAKQARDVVLVGLAACRTCRGFVLLDRTEAESSNLLPKRAA